MRVIEPHQLRQSSLRKARVKARWKATCVILLLLIISTGLYFRMQRPWTGIRGVSTSQSTPGEQVKLSWPRRGQAAFGAQGFGVLETTHKQPATPTASVAKVVLALAVLRERPIEVGQEGGMIQLTKKDVALYKKEIGRMGSRVRVKDGEKISEYDALQALLLPSANNIAATLANWAFGSEDKYVDYANDLVSSLKMTDTVISDASGFSSKTKSTAEDVLLLGQAALSEPIITQIVAKKSATIPVEGRIHNVNNLLGHDGIIGIKTGNTDQAGGCYLFAAKHNFSKDNQLTLVGSVMAAPNLSDAVAEGQALLRSSYKYFSERTIVQKGQVVGYYDVPWGGRVDVLAAEDLTIFGWSGNSMTTKPTLENVASTTRMGEPIGNLTVGDKSIKLVLKNDIPSPGLSWRLTHLFSSSVY